MKTSSVASTNTGRPRPWPSGRLLAGILAFSFGLISIGAYATQAPDGTAVQVGASALLFAGAALLVGGLIGFLFGIPRTLTSDNRQVNLNDGTDQRGSIHQYYGANTNLEQISDWLTKILVGIGLTQLGEIRLNAARLVDSMAPALGAEPQSGPFAAGLLTYFSVLGFLAGWLLTRILLAPALSAADRRVFQVLLQADLADAVGDAETANRYRKDALSLLQRAIPVAAWYEELRQAVPRGSARSRRMDELLGEARREAGQSESLSSDEVAALFERGTEGLRIYALGLMQGNEILADFDTVMKAIEGSRSAFEQYHAIKLAQRMLPRLNGIQKERLKLALLAQCRGGGWIKPGTDRWRLSRSILDAIEGGG